jgi:hypothetical protein
MASLLEKINNDLIDALKKKDHFSVQTLRMLIAAIHNREIEKRSGGEKGVTLSDDEIFGIIRREVKKRKEAAEIYIQGNRPELAEKENNELKVLEGYLPPELSPEEIKQAVRAAIVKISPVGPKDFGKVMGEVMRGLGGRANAELVGQIVREALGQGAD